MANKIKINKNLSYLRHREESEIALFYRAIEKYKKVWVGGRHVLTSSFLFFFLLRKNSP